MTYFKHIYLLLILMGIAETICAQAQEFFNISYAPSGEEELYILRDYDPQGLSSQTQWSSGPWDISILKAPFARLTKLSPSSIKPMDFAYDILLRTDRGLSMYLKREKNGYYLIAQEGMILASYNIPIRLNFDEPLLLFPNQISSSSSSVRCNASGSIAVSNVSPLIRSTFSLPQDATLYVGLDLTINSELLGSGELKYLFDNYQVGCEKLSISYAYTFTLKDDEGRELSLPQNLAQNTNFSEYRTRFFTPDHFYPIAQLIYDEHGGLSYAEYNPRSNLQFYKMDQRTSLDEELLTVYPNPTYKDVKFMFEGFLRGSYKIKIMNILGQPVLEKDLVVNGDDAITVDLSSFQKGTYLYTVSNHLGRIIATRRLVILSP